MSETCVANPQLGYNDLFLSWFSEGWSPFSQSGLYLEEFVVNFLIPVLLPFCKKEFIDLGFQVSIQNRDIVGLISKADLAAESALLFLLTPMWLGIQHIIISLWLDIESHLLSSLTINGFSSFLFLSDVNTESESANMINLLRLFSEMMVRARSMAHASAVKMELFIGRAFLWMVLLRTVAHAVLLLSLEQSINMYWWSEWCKRIVWNFSR